MPLGFPPEGFESGLLYEPGEGDVFVSTYPKCGTTWAQYIVYLLVHRGRPLADEQSLGDVFPHLEEVGKDVVAALPEPRLIKTHLPRPLAPYDECAKYVYVARNPFDCAVSFYHHTRGFPRHYEFSNGTFADFFDCFILGEVDFGDYFDHLLSWHELVGSDNVLFLTYEEMLGDQRSAIRRIADFLGGAARESAADSIILEQIAVESSLESMRRGQQRWASERPADMPKFIRQGKVGDWRNLFTQEQARRLLERLDRAAAGTEIAGYWPDVIEDARLFSRGP